MKWMNSNENEDRWIGIFNRRFVMAISLFFPFRFDIFIHFFLKNFFPLMIFSFEYAQLVAGPHFASRAERGDKSNTWRYFNAWRGPVASALEEPFYHIYLRDVHADGGRICIRVFSPRAQTTALPPRRGVDGR